MHNCLLRLHPSIDGTEKHQCFDSDCSNIRSIHSRFKPPVAMSQLSYARYGKDNVRLYKVDKDSKTGVHNIVEQTVRILLEGDIETS